MNADGSGVRRLTDHPGLDQAPVWSPDGARLAFQSDRDGNWEIYTIGADGSGLTNLTKSPAEETQPKWR
jgi:Tol biopolymer transport system component